MAGQHNEKPPPPSLTVAPLMEPFSPCQSLDSIFLAQPIAHDPGDHGHRLIGLESRVGISRSAADQKSEGQSSQGTASPASQTRTQGQQRRRQPGWAPDRS